ncbi:MAG: sigma-70 family RNA polymerase sigma factor [Sedimentisphaerales bacterium]|nr:sigma-70 family RNA polymerase sigma factor [Sedimentisphaerales bacterium]
MAAITPEQLGHLYDTHAGALGLYARQWLNGDGADDVVQDAFIRLIQQRRSPDNVRAWLYSTVRNRTISEYRRQRGCEQGRCKLAAGKALWFEAHPGDLLDARTAQAALETLDPDERELVVLRLWSDLTFKEIAEITGRPISTLHRQYQETLVKLKNILVTSCKTKT